MDMLSGIHEGNDESGAPYRLTRKLVFLKPRNLLLIVDLFEGHGECEGITQFILAGAGWQESANGVFSDMAPGFKVTVQTVSDILLTTDLKPSEVSPAYLQKAEGRRLRFGRTGVLPARIVTAIHWGSERRDMELTLASASNMKVQIGAETIWGFVRADCKAQSRGKLQTDASAAFIFALGDRIEAAWALNVSKLTFESKPLLNGDRLIYRWGWPDQNSLHSL
jgi:hypothetical protein